MTEIKHGGKRPGAGRKPVDPNGTQRIQALLTREQIELATEIGQGNLSRGIRRAIEYWDSRRPQFDVTSRPEAS